MRGDDRHDDSHLHPVHDWQLDCNVTDAREVGLFGNPAGWLPVFYGASHPALL
jgi:hypothetical protein